MLYDARVCFPLYICTLICIQLRVSNEILVCVCPTERLHFLYICASVLKSKVAFGQSSRAMASSATHTSFLPSVLFSCFGDGRAPPPTVVIAGARVGASGFSYIESKHP